MRLHSMMMIGGVGTMNTSTPTTPGTAITPTAPLTGVPVVAALTATAPAVVTAAATATKPGATVMVIILPLHRATMKAAAMAMAAMAVT